MEFCKHCCTLQQANQWHTCKDGLRSYLRVSAETIPGEHQVQAPVQMPTFHPGSLTAAETKFLREVDAIRAKLPKPQPVTPNPLGGGWVRPRADHSTPVGKLCRLCNIFYHTESCPGCRAVIMSIPSFTPGDSRGE